ncbi:hypothetical protein [Methylotuvimicrobium buryatense]|uniref:Uncharacterized protein n=1 Tax=Methylotuvimicrobium buryatense TaxID=95641 RepID=A0A4P9UQZ4_METBY|nr:hypothetical protein [Methylotuvimicrobium buryatense]QCW83882.1 hypothetical protein EQU24_17765 [Methylotuvimicrobium buryatense]
MSEERIIAEVSHTGLVELNLPEYADRRVEVIVWPVEEIKPLESIELATMQQENGFAMAVLADPEEDVWNDL